MSSSVQPVPLLESLAVKKLLVQKQFAKQHSYAKKWFDEKNLSLDEIRKHSQRLLTGATLGSALLLASPKIPLISQPEISLAVKMHTDIESFLNRIRSISASSLSLNTEEEIMRNIKNIYGVSTAFELDNNRLPDYSGWIGLEQHLYRFPGDTSDQHNYPEQGIAPVRGAFGYFAENGKSQEIMIEEEKYYIVLQTFLIPEWNSNWVTLKPWYKFRKFMVINPENGKAVVAVLGDSGPGVSTGKVFGGSPEVMEELGFFPKKHKGEVMVLFLDDPGNQVSLGPISAKEEQ